MEAYNYFYYSTPITKSEFLKNVPENWIDDVDEFGKYSYGGYWAQEREIEND